MSNPARQFRRAHKRHRLTKALELFNKMPKPPVVDGVCACGCVITLDKGPCPMWERGSGERCLICDHSIACHRRKGEPPPKDWNGKPKDEKLPTLRQATAPAMQSDNPATMVADRADAVRPPRD